MGFIYRVLGGLVVPALIGPIVSRGCPAAQGGENL